jgi:uncharacterized protein
MSEISSLTELLAVYNTLSPVAAKKELTHIDRQARAFIGRSSFLVIATADADGWPDASPRGDASGFVTVEDDARLLMPDRPGNNRVDSFKNLVANPRIGMLFFVPGHLHSLRINGEARILTDATLCERFAVNGRPARAVVEVTARQVYFHCGKSLIRAKLWSTEHWPSREGLASLGRAIADQVPGLDAFSLRLLLTPPARVTRSRRASNCFKLRHHTVCFATPLQHISGPACVRVATGRLPPSAPSYANACGHGRFAASAALPPPWNRASAAIRRSILNRRVCQPESSDSIHSD